jgi:sterol desaturase/sphingolipid hydroxylase (fatty acid hydroxylase superfamily)
MLLNRLLYFGDFVACPLAIFGLVMAVPAHGTLSQAGIFCLACVIGLGAWTLVEYAVHRWVYHKVVLFDKLHDAHHQQPSSLVGAPSFLSIAVMFLIFFIPIGLVDRVVAAGFTTGILCGYFGYILVHHASHHWPLKLGSLLYRARLRHMAHHFRDSEGNYGVTTGFWDHVFATHIEASRTASRS